ncbi:MAG: hypothetical protein JWQ98_2340 [Chlorobi bacterium]|nr:hypothetical protein [Chlorobiota bacterium]
MITQSLFILILTIAASLSIQAQTTGTLLGRITDTTGKPLVGALVRILGTMPLRGAIVKANGSYIVAGIRPGNYRVSIRAIGFRESHKDVAIAIDTKTILDARLAEVTLAELRADTAYFGYFHYRFITLGQVGTEHHITSFDLDPGWGPNRQRYVR